MSLSCNVFLEMGTREKVRELVPAFVASGDLLVCVRNDGATIAVKCAGCGMTAFVEDEETQASILALVAKKNGGQVS